MNELTELYKLHLKILEDTFDELVKTFKDTIEGIDNACIVAFAQPASVEQSLRQISVIVDLAKEMLDKVEAE